MGHVAFKVSKESWLAPQIDLAVDGKKFVANAGLTAHAQAIEYLVNASTLTNTTARKSAKEVETYLSTMTKPAALISLNYPKPADSPEAVYSVRVCTLSLGDLLARAKTCLKIDEIMTKAEAASLELEKALAKPTAVNAYPSYAEGKEKGKRASKTLAPASDL